MEEHFTIDGMKCEANCASSVTRAALSVDGVSQASVDLPHRSLVITYSPSLPVSLTDTRAEEVAMAVEEAGYTAHWGRGKCIRYFKVSGMFCDHCKGTIEKAVMAIDRVKRVIVDLDRHVATVIMEEQADVAAILDAIDCVGYDAEPYEGSRDVTLCISGMKCKTRCGNTVHNALRRLPGVACVKVDVSQGIAQVRGSAKFEDIASAVEGAGAFTVTCSQKDETSSSETTTSLPTTGDTVHPVNLDESTGHSFGSSVGNLADSRTLFSIKGMSCGACVAGIERLLLGLPGVQQATVALLTERGEVLYDSKKISWQTLLSAIEGAGYRANHVTTRSNSSSDCDERRFMITSRAHVDVKKECEGVTALLDSGGVLEVRWLNANDENIDESGGSSSVLEVTYDPAVVGLRYILESLVKSNPQFSVSLMKRKGGGAESMEAQNRETDKLLRDLIFASALTAPLSVMMWTGVLMENVIPGLTLMDVAAVFLATPVQFVCGQRFYKEAYRGLLSRTLGMGFLVVLGTTCAYVFGLMSVVHSVLRKGHVPSYTDNFMTSAMLISFVLLGKYMESRAKSYTSVALQKLMEKQPNTAILLSTKSKGSKEGTVGYEVISERSVPSELLSEGDLVKVVRGMIIPSDGEVVLGGGEVNESLITGEALPVSKCVGDDVIGGTQLVEGLLHIRVRSLPENSVLSQIIKLVENAQMKKAPIQRTADSIAGVFALCVIGAAVAVFIMWHILLAHYLVPRWMLPQNVSNFVVAFTFSISTLVVACPCAMGLATPTAIMVGTGVGAKLGILIKGGEALETANRLTTIVFDKTGTLTMGCPDVSTIYLLSSSGSHMVKVRGSSADGVQAVGEQGRVAASSAEDSIYDICSGQGASSVVLSSIDTQDLNSDEFMDEDGLLWMVASAELNSEHLIGRAIVRHAQSRKHLPPLEHSDEVSATTGKGIKCMVLGYEVIVGSLNFLREEDVQHSHNSTFANMAIAAQEQGSIVVFAAINGSMRGMIQLADKPRPEAADTVAALHALGKKVWIVTGDSIRTATSLGAMVGVPTSNIISEALPSTKIQHVMRLQDEGEYVGFVGDGINDAPAVAQADVGIAIGGGTDVAMESADMVLMRADIFSVVTAIDLSHAILRCIRRNLFWALAYNVVSIPLAAGLSLPIFHTVIPPWVAGMAMAMSSVSVVLSSLSLLSYQPPIRQNSVGVRPTNAPMRTLVSNVSPQPQVDSPFRPSGLESLLSFAGPVSDDSRDGVYSGMGMLEMEGERTSLLENRKHYGSTDQCRM